MSYVELENTPFIAKARKNLNLPAEGRLSRTDANRVRKEAGILKTIKQVKRLNPRAVVRRKKDGTLSLQIPTN
jgi:hypothetical protein